MKHDHPQVNSRDHASLNGFVADPVQDHGSASQLWPHKMTHLPMQKLKTALGIVIATGCATGCSSIDVISNDAPIPEGRCSVTVYQTRGQALKHGAIDELCIINGTSSGSFSHTISTAVQKHKDKACSCGATRVFIESRSESGWDVATVTLVAFRYLEKVQEPSPAMPSR